MNRWALATIFVIGFTAALVGTVPMSFALSWLGADQAGVSAAAVSGSIWNGRLKAAHYRAIPLGDVQAALDPFALISGTRRLAVNGTLVSAIVVEGASRGFETAYAAIEVAHLRPAFPLAGRVRLEQATLLFSQERCVRAEGRLATDILKRAFDGPEVTGTLACAGEAAVARLDGRLQDGEVSIVLRLDSAGRYQAETRVTSTSPMVRVALALAGFSESGGGFIRSDEGALGT
jgi:general secretion pathway protein N